MPLTVGAISESMSAEQVVNILTGSYSQEDHIDPVSYTHLTLPTTSSV